MLHPEDTRSGTGGVVKVAMLLDSVVELLGHHPAVGLLDIDPLDAFGSASVFFSIACANGTFLHKLPLTQTGVCNLFIVELSLGGFITNFVSHQGCDALHAGCPNRAALCLLTVFGDEGGVAPR